MFNNHRQTYCPRPFITGDSTHWVHNCPRINFKLPGPRLNIKTSSYRYGQPYVKEKASCPCVDGLKKCLFTSSDCAIASHLSLTSSLKCYQPIIPVSCDVLLLASVSKYLNFLLRYISDLCPISANVFIGDPLNSVFSCAADREFTTRRTCC